MLYFLRLFLFSPLLSGNEVFQITLTRTYGMTNLQEDLKSMYKVTGLKGKPLTFIFTDAEVCAYDCSRFLN